MNGPFSSAEKILATLAAVLPADAFWLVGGSVRDLLMGREPFDYDIAVRGNPAESAAAFAQKVGSRAIPIGPTGRQIHRVVDSRTVYDFSSLAGKTIEEDLLQRDFTVDAMALSPSRHTVIDPSGGQEDLKKGWVRMLSEDVFSRDPVRLLRAYRLATVFHLRIEPETEAQIRRHAGLIRHCAGERVRDELYKLLAVEEAAKTILLMNHSGLLGRILPEMAALAGCRQGGFHEHDVLEHTLHVLSHMESIFADPAAWIPRHGAAAARAAVCADRVPLKIAALLHDIGKPAARREKGGRIHFRGHAAVGHRMAEDIFMRLHLSTRNRRLIGFLIRRHTDPLQLFIARERGTLTRRAITRFFIRTGSLTPPLMLLAVADAAGKKTPADDRYVAFSSFTDELLDSYFRFFAPKSGEPPLVRGKELMAALGLSPSPMLGKILKKIEAERLEGRLNTKEEALARSRELAEKMLDA